MIKIRRSEDRGHFDHGWLDTYHSFSFGHYHDNEYSQFKSLRVLNEDRVLAGEGFGTHPHNNMEIISYVISGRLAHQDSMGHKQTLSRGEVQVMSAGTGITHSEYNDADETTHFLQIWIIPEKQQLEPHYDQRLFSESSKKNKLQLLVDKNGTDGALKINRDIRFYGSILERDTELVHKTDGNAIWVQLVSGELSINETTLKAGDGAAITEEQNITIKAKEESELVLIDLGE